MAQDGRGAPRIHEELTKLGFFVSEMTVSRYLPRRPTDPDQVRRWIAFLRNHKDEIAAMDLFTVPTAAWVIQQLREAFPYDAAPRYLIFDRDSIFSSAVVEFIKAMGIVGGLHHRYEWREAA